MKKLKLPFKKVIHRLVPLLLILKITILAVAHNQTNTKQLAIAHGEIEAIQLACKILGQKKLNDCILYVNAESCAMCSVAIIKSGISQVFYGAPHENDSNPDLYLREVNKKAVPQLKVHGGIMKGSAQNSDYKAR